MTTKDDFYFLEPFGTPMTALIARTKLNNRSSTANTHHAYAQRAPRMRKHTALQTCATFDNYSRPTTSGQDVEFSHSRAATLFIRLQSSGL